MSSKDFSTTIVVDQSAKEVFDAVNNVRGWWSEEIEGDTDQPGAIFDYHYEDVHRCKMKIIEFVPNERVSWRVLENYFNFTEDRTEWTGTTIVFDITPENGRTRLRMTHQGLVPEYECFDICRDSWTNYIQQSFRLLVSTGKGKPNGKGKPQTDNEKKLTEKN
jgi:hypothetical protein